MNPIFRHYEYRSLDSVRAFDGLPEFKINENIYHKLVGETRKFTLTKRADGTAVLSITEKLKGLEKLAHFQSRTFMLNDLKAHELEAMEVGLTQAVRMQELLLQPGQV